MNLYRAKELKKEHEHLTYLLWVNRKTTFEESYEKNIKQAKQLKEKVEKGCGGSACGVHVGYGIDADVDIICCGDYCTYHKNKPHCKECTETLKILNEILGEKE